MRVAGGAEHAAAFLLPADDGVGDPGVVEDLS